MPFGDFTRLVPDGAVAVAGILAMFAGSLIAGCVTPQLSVRVVQFNDSFEKANNEMLLLNVVRASKRRPLYFTSFSGLHGGASFYPSNTQISLPFGPGAQGQIATRTFTESLGYSQSTFDLTTLDGQDFIRGIVTPVDTQEIHYLWQQGFPPELLWMLFVQKFEIYYGDSALLRTPDKDLFKLAPCAGEKPLTEDRQNFLPEKEATRSYNNYPEDKDSMELFKCKMRELLDPNFGFKPVKKTGSTRVGPLLGANEASKLADLVAIKQADGYSLKSTKRDGFQLNKKEVTYSWSAGAECDTEGEDSAVSRAGQACRDYYVFQCKDQKPQDTTKCHSQAITVYLRSPEAIIYYLGELVRVEGRARTVPEYIKVSVCNARLSTKSTPFSTDTPIFALDQGRVADAVVKVDYDQSTFWIKRATSAEYFDQCEQENSIHVLSIVNLLIALQKTAKEAPATGVVRVVP